MTDTPRLGIVGFGAQGSVYAELVSDDMVRDSSSSRRIPQQRSTTTI
jgi:hypothetical protein